MTRVPKKSEPSRVGELALIQRIRLRAGQNSATAPGVTPELQLGIGDDCALLRPAPGEELAVTTDLSIAGRHFRLDWHPAESVGHRALARGLSDLAAMGARPVAAFLSLALPRDLVQSPKARGAARGPQAEGTIWPGPKGREPWVDRFLDGFLSLAQAHHVPLAGGDLAESTLAVADVILTGAVPQGEALLRSGARPGDLIYVTGSLGGAAVGFDYLTKLAAEIERASPRKKASLPSRIPPRLKALLTPHLYPTPRVAQGLWLARNAMATAAIDLSDGLSTDLAHLCAESGVTAEIDAAALPFAPGANPAQALNCGEDYELLFTAPPAARFPSSIEGVAVTCIGRILSASDGDANKGAADGKAARNAPGHIVEVSKGDASKGAAKPSRPPITLITSKGAVPLTPQGWQHFS
jgi:thiamine-monophosphate kinase